MNRLGLSLVATLLLGCSDDGLMPAQSDGADDLPLTTGRDTDELDPDTGVGPLGTGGSTSGTNPGTTGPEIGSDGDSTSVGPTPGTSSDSGSTDGGSSSDSGESSSSGGESSSGSESSSDGGMMVACPEIAGTNLVGGPADLYGFCWYIGAPMDTCDMACAQLPGGTNLAAMAESSYPDHCDVASAEDVSTWFVNNGNPAGWTATGGGTAGHTLGYGYSIVGNYYGKCSTGPVTVGSYPGEAVGGGLEAQRQLICACAFGSP